MELRQLRYIVALAEERSFTRAAGKVLVAQPALSQQIAKLEAELGLPLVDRTTHRVAMTEAGDRLVEHARRVLKQVEVAREDLADLAGLRTGHLTIGASRTVGALDLSALLAEFYRRYPAVDLAVREDPASAWPGSCARTSSISRSSRSPAMLRSTGSSFGLSRARSWLRCCRLAMS